ncbi:MAG: hypothetical protein AB1414_12390 [bacterium]
MSQVNSCPFVTNSLILCELCTSVAERLFVPFVVKLASELLPLSDRDAKAA